MVNDWYRIGGISQIQDVLAMTWNYTWWWGPSLRVWGI